ncbi:MAG: photosynthetic reaction center subunit H [Burkholderiales bacterium]|nr:photosynthetic reaction center subunit H [Burkholderiales bacterium]
MGTGAITQYVDLAQLILYVFWAFFFGLIYYLTLESKREGFPLEYDQAGKVRRDPGLIGMPAPKIYKTQFHGDIVNPRPEPLDVIRNARPAHRFNGAPLEPIGNPMLAAVGPGSYANRPDYPDLTFEGQPVIVPMRILPGFAVAKPDIDPRGLPVVGADGARGGVIKEIWVDRAEMVIRYLELETTAENGSRRVMLPMNFARVQSKKIAVQSILGNQFAEVPAIKSQDQITMLEEERVMAYYGAGTLYATPERREPLI